MVKLPGSFTSDTTNWGLTDEEVYKRGPIWINKDLVEVGQDGNPIVVNGRTITIEREILVSKADVYTDTTTCEPLTLVTCEPGFEPDDDEFTEFTMLAWVEEDMEAVRKAQHEERVRQRQAEQSKTTDMDTTPATTDPMVIPGTNLHVVTLQGVTMEDFSKTGRLLWT